MSCWVAFTYCKQQRYHEIGFGGHTGSYTGIHVRVFDETNLFATKFSVAVGRGGVGVAAFDSGNTGVAGEG